MKYILGPVPSRRLGYTLIINIIPDNTCTYDCIYCEAGKTKNKTINRIDFNNENEIIEELKTLFTNNKGPIDTILLAGRGEPTLNKKLEIIFKKIKKMTSTPIAIKTNCSLLNNEEIKKHLLNYDIVIMEIDTVNEDTYKILNRPSGQLSLKNILIAVKEFIKQYEGKILMEIFFVKGINDSDIEILQWRKFLEKLKITNIQINTITRTPAYEEYDSINEKDMERIKSLLGDLTETKLIFNNSSEKINRDDIEKLLLKRPCTFEEISSVLKISINDLRKILQELQRENKLKIEHINNDYFYGIKDE